MQLNDETQPARIVVADDHAVVRAGICAALNDLPNVQVVAQVGDGPGVFAALTQHRPDGLVIDVSMPDFDPLRAVRQIRATYPGLKILVVSAYDDDVYVQGLLQAGVDGYHLKDQPLDDMRLAIQRVLAGERWVCSPLLTRLMRGPQVQVADVALTQRQRELLWCLQQGDDNHTIARRMNLSVKTVENHLTRLYRQLNVQSRLEAVHYLGQHPELPLAVLAETPFAAPNSPITVLLVDDNSRYRQHLRRMVGKVCPQAFILEVATTQEAIEAARNLPHLALVDVVLGDEDGIICTHRIKATAPSTRVILISAYPDREFRRRGLEVGAIALLDKKDLDSAALREVIEDCLESMKHEV